MSSKTLPNTFPKPVPLLLKVNTKECTKNLFIWFRLIGITTPKRMKVIYFVYSFVFKVFNMLLTPLAFALSYFIGSKDLQLSNLFTSTHIFIQVCSCAVRSVFTAVNKSRLLRLGSNIDKLDSRIKYLEEIREARSCIQFGNRIVIIIAAIYYFYSSVTFLGAIYLGRPPYSLYNPFLSWRDSRRNLLAVSAFELFLVNGSILQQIANDTYSLVYMRILYSHMKILVMRVNRIGTDPQCTQAENKRELVRCIADHQNIMQLSDGVGSVMSATYFVQFILSAGALGTTLININISTDSSVIFGSTVYAVCLVLQTLPICYFVNCLVAEAECLPYAIFYTNWMDQDKEFGRLCILFMLRSQKKLIFYAGKIFTISLDTFMGIVRFAFSLYTLLNTIGIGNLRN